MARRSHRRLLDALADQFPDYSRDELYRYAMAGDVRVDGATLTDPATMVAAAARLELVREPFVSRGGTKLAHALQTWRLIAARRVWLDAGASTGGFTDCLLQRGARAVHAVDVGYNQLHWRIRADLRVIVHERTNVLDLGAGTHLDPPPDALVADLSFRSLRGVLGPLLRMTREGWGVVLMKPQFELAAEARWGRNPHERLEGGVVAADERSAVIARLTDDLAREGVTIHRTADSPIAGHSGNREVLALVGLSVPVDGGTRDRTEMS